MTRRQMTLDEFEEMYNTVNVCRVKDGKMVEARVHIFRVGVAPRRRWSPV